VREWQAGAFPSCVVEGPIALDVALSPEAARHKAIQSQVSGDVDLFLVPSIEAGNLMAKGMVYYAKAKFAGVILGASHPMVLVSRADPAEAKLNALAMAALLAGG
jgi:phosphate butyryltransferase